MKLTNNFLNNQNYILGKNEIKIIHLHFHGLGNMMVYFSYLFPLYFLYHSYKYFIGDYYNTELYSGMVALFCFSILFFYLKAPGGKYLKKRPKYFDFKNIDLDNYGEFK